MSSSEWILRFLEFSGKKGLFLFVNDSHEMCISDLEYQLEVQLFLLRKDIGHNVGRQNNHDLKGMFFFSSCFQSCQIGLNFASEEEAKRFRAALNDLLGRRLRKTGNYKHLGSADQTSSCSLYL